MTFSSDPTYPLFPVFAAVGFVLVLVPLPWHLQAWNAGTCLYMIWTALACLNQFVNSIVWHGNALNPAPVWCDISSRFLIGSAVAIPAASLCINRRLYKIATMQSTSITRAQKRRAIVEDLAIGLGIPFVEMALQYIVSGHRFNIFEDIGCFPATMNVWLTYVLVGMWPIIIGLISAVYCVLSLRSFLRRQAQFNAVLACSTISKNRYFRLMALATTELLCTVPFSAVTIYLNLTAAPITPYKGWADLHFNYSRVDQIPSTIWRLNKETVVALEMGRWLVVACALLFFLFFGFAEEARRNYCSVCSVIAEKSGLSRLLRSFRRERANQKNVPYVLRIGNNPSAGILPVFVNRLPSTPGAKNRESFETVVTRGAETRASVSTLAVSPPAEKTEVFTECFGHAI